MLKLKQRPILVLQILSFTIMGAAGTVMNFMNLYLEEVVGLTGSQIGAVPMVSLVPVILLTPLLGYIGDKTGKHVLMLRIAFLATAVTFYLYSLTTTFWLILLIAALFEASRALIPAFFDLVTTNQCKKIGYDFGKVRVLASYGFLLVTMLVGFVIDGVQIPILDFTLGFEGFLSIRMAVFGTFILLMLVSLIFSFYLPSGEEKKESKKSKFNRSDVKELFANKQYRFMVLFVILSLIAFETAKAFFANHLVLGLGASRNIVSWTTLIMVGPELILLPFGSKVMKKFGFKNWYIFTMITMIARMVVYSLTGSVFVFATAGIFHSIGITTHIAGNISFVRHVVPAKILGLAFAIMTSLFALSRAILSLVYGTLYEWFDGYAVFRFATVLLVLGLILVVKSDCLKEVGDEITSQT